MDDLDYLDDLDAYDPNDPKSGDFLDRLDESIARRRDDARTAGAATPPPRPAIPVMPANERADLIDNTVYRADAVRDLEAAGIIVRRINARAAEQATP